MAIASACGRTSRLWPWRACGLLRFGCGSILLKKYFGGVERNLQELLLRFLRSDARDYITSPKNDHGASYRHYGASALRNRPKTDICEIFGVVRFSTFSTLSINSRSNSARPPSTVSISLPCAVVVSAQVSRRDRKPAPLSATVPRVLSKSLVDLARRSRRVTTSTSSLPRRPISLASCLRSAL